MSTLVSARDSHIKPDSEALREICFEGWYQERYGKFHVIIYLSHILHWVFLRIDFYIAYKIFELTNFENKSSRELPFSVWGMHFQSTMVRGKNDAFLCCVLHSGTWYDWECICLHGFSQGWWKSVTFTDCYLVMGDFIHHDKAWLSGSIFEAATFKML
jgi:hypothetical protein